MILRGNADRQVTDAHVRQTESDTPWSQAVEGAIRELKKGVGREMVRTKARSSFGTVASNERQTFSPIQPTILWSWMDMYRK